MGKNLYVGNLPYSATDEFLAETFGQCGSVASAKIITDRETGRSKGFGFVEMSTDEEAQAAIDKFDGTEIEGRPMKVNEARPKAPRGDFGGGGGGGRGGRGGFGGGGGGGRGGRKTLLPRSQHEEQRSNPQKRGSEIGSTAACCLAATSMSPLDSNTSEAF